MPCIQNNLKIQYYNDNSSLTDLIDSMNYNENINKIPLWKLAEPI